MSTNPQFIKKINGPLSDDGVIIRDSGMTISDGEGTTQTGEITNEKGISPAHIRELRFGKKKVSEYGKMTFFVNKR